MTDEEWARCPFCESIAGTSYENSAREIDEYTCPNEECDCQVFKVDPSSTETAQDGGGR